MRTIELTGTVDAEGRCENGSDVGHWGDSVTIGERCVACAVESLASREDEGLSVVLAHGGDEALYRGSAYSDHGARGWSEYTPAESPTIEVDDFDLRARLYELDGEMVHLRLETT